MLKISEGEAQNWECNILVNIFTSSILQKTDSNFLVCIYILYILLDNFVLLIVLCL